MKKYFFCLAFLLSLMLTTACFAGERAGAFSVSPFAGGYTFEGEQHMKTAPVYGLRLGYDLTDNFGIEAVGNYLSTEGTRSPHTSINALSYRLDLLYNFMPEGPLVPYLAVGGGGITAGHGSGMNTGWGNNTSATANVGGGIKYFITDSVALRGDARHLFVCENKTLYNWEYTAGLSFLFGGNKPAPAPVVAAPPACNLAVAPATIIQGQNAKLSWSSENASECSIQPNIGPVKTQGSMEITPSADTFYTLTCTGEGGRASSDANITVAAPVKPEAPKCNLSVTPASIMKGEAATLNWTCEYATDCDIQPAIGAVKTDGSREVTPAVDTAYTLACTGPGGKATSNASLAVTTPAPTMEELCMTLHIEYDNDKSIIKPAYYGEVEKVASFMTRFPEIKGTIEGHTDSNASAKYNQKLSQRRAEGVVKMLFEKYGIDKSRLAAKGYGESQPIADNKTKAGRQQNRRTMANFGCVSVEKK
jgi:OOP family OmpA-OmpF porin